MTKSEAHNLLEMVKNGILIEAHRVRKALIITGDIPNVLGRPRKQASGALREDGDRSHRTFALHDSDFQEGLSGPWKKGSEAAR